MDKLLYFQTTYCNQLQQIAPNEKPQFGKMNVHQMIEHMSYAFKQAAGLIPTDPLHDEEMTEKMYRFAMSDKPFKDNTPNVLLPNEPLPTKFTTIEESLNELKNDIEIFVDAFKNEPNKRILNPFFGNLNFQEWQQLLYKHAQHHLRQFNQL